MHNYQIGVKMNENLDLDLIVDTKLYEYAKTGMELSLTILCQQLEQTNIYLKIIFKARIFTHNTF